MPQTYMRTWPGSSGDKGSSARDSVLYMRKVMGVSSSKSCSSSSGGIDDNGQQAGNHTSVEKHLVGYNSVQYKAPSAKRLQRPFNSQKSSDDMKHGLAIIFAALRLLPLALACAMGSAHADDYDDVGQLLRNGQTAQAMAKADLYLAAKPRDPQMRFLKGVIQSNTGKQADAIQTFTQLNEDYPELPEPYNNLAVLYAGQGQHPSRHFSPPQPSTLLLGPARR